MKVSAHRPRVHFFVCTNRRADDDPLGRGCGAHGDATFDALKRAVGRRGLVADVWVARTQCLGVCPKVGCTVGLSPGPHYLEECSPEDAEALLDSVVATAARA